MTHNSFKNEGDVKKVIKQLLKKHDWWYFMPAANQFGRGGIPDFICCKAGRFLAIEAKYGYNKPKPLQEDRMDEIRTAGGKAVWVNENRLPALARMLELFDASL